MHQGTKFSKACIPRKIPVYSRKNDAFNGSVGIKGFDVTSSQPVTMNAIIDMAI